MPILTRGNEKIHFIHIPKNAGTSIISMLHSEGWIYHDRKNNAKHETREKWETKFLDVSYQFAVVRNPYEKIESKYWQSKRSPGLLGMPLAYKVLPEKNYLNCMNLVAHGYTPSCKNNGLYSTRVDPHTGPAGLEYISFKIGDKFCAGSQEDFFHYLAYMLYCSIQREGINVDDNHFQPQTKFIGDRTCWFKIEEIDKMLEALRELNIISASASLPVIRHRFRGEESIDSLPRQNINLNLNWKDPRYDFISKKFIDFYQQDFIKFNYEI